MRSFVWFSALLLVTASAMTAQTASKPGGQSRQAQLCSQHTRSSGTPRCHALAANVVES